jgi:hypothetical protein
MRTLGSRKGRRSERLLNDLIRPQQQRRRDGEAECLGGLEVDDEFELGRLFDRKVGRLGAFENSSDVGGDVASHSALK